MILKSVGFTNCVKLFCSNTVRRRSPWYFYHRTKPSGPLLFVREAPCTCAKNERKRGGGSEREREREQDRERKRKGRSNRDRIRENKGDKPWWEGERDKETRRASSLSENTCLLITHSCISASVTNYPPPRHRHHRGRPAGRLSRAVPHARSRSDVRLVHLPEYNAYRCNHVVTGFTTPVLVASYLGDPLGPIRTRPSRIKGRPAVIEKFPPPSNGYPANTAIAVRGEYVRSRRPAASLKPPRTSIIHRFTIISWPVCNVCGTACNV